ncbi:unnamed protein product [Ixodes pacificus]
MSELKPWLLEAESLLAYKPNEGDDIENCKERLEQIKKCEEEIGAKRSNLLSVILGGSLVKPSEVESLEARFQKVSVSPSVDICSDFLKDWWQQTHVVLDGGLKSAND